MTSRYHGSKIPGSQQTFLTETARKKSMGNRFLPECNLSEESHTGRIFSFFLPYLQDHCLLSFENFSAKAT